jgi:polysaccharide transporter, PST family
MPPAAARTSSLRTNISALYAVQLSNYIVPLLTLPWLTRMLGPQQFGRLGFSLAICNYFALFTDYGFNLSATRAIAVHADNPAARAAIFWNTMSVKAILALIGFGLLMALTPLVPPLGAERALLALCYLTVVGAVLTPTWFFLGTERQRTLSITTIAVRLAAVPVTFLLVHTPADLPKAIAIAGCSPVAVGILCLARLARERSIRATAITRTGLVHTLKDGWHLFLSNISMSLYTNSNTVLLGLIAGPSAVGYYTPAERLIQATQGLLSPINQSVYPRVCRLMHESRADAFLLIRKVLLLLGTLALSLSIVLFSIAPVLVHLLYGSAYRPVTPVLRWLSPLPFVIALSNVFGLHTMLPLGMKRSFSGILMLAGPLNVLAMLILAHFFGPVGAAAAVLTTELFVTSLMAIQLRRRDVPIFGPVALA